VHAAVDELDDDDLVPPDDGGLAPVDDTDDDAASRRVRRSHLYTPLPLEYLRGQAEAMADLGVPGHLLGAYPPDALLPMDTLRALLYQETTPLAVRDAVWRYLIANAVGQRGRWYVYVVGVVALRLIERAYYLTPGGEHGEYDDKWQVHHHLAVGLLAELFNVRPDDEHIGTRIIHRAVYRAKQAWWENREVQWPPIPGSPDPDPDAVPEADLEPQEEPQPPADESPPPDDELASVLRALVVATADVRPSRTDRRPKLTAQDAALVALCCLFGRTIPEAAQEIGMSADAARAKLPRIKRAVFTLLASRYLHARHPQWGIGPPADAATTDATTTDGAAGHRPD